ncbi:MAG: hypothetical protein M3Y13_14810 [Armatimonadota bacterium]|nr:hypothetical protein [Armatimonadota bacterium]
MVDKIEPLRLDCGSPLSEMYTLSPFVWREAGRYALLLRAVPRSKDPAEKIARIYAGHSEDGLCFAMDAQPIIKPGPSAEDRDGCEDPTVIVTEGETFVYYSGWNEADKRGELLLAAGADSRDLHKRGVMLPPTAGYANPKEATVVQVPDGSWRLFFEYAADDASKIGLASAPAVDGPWTLQQSPVEARPGRWDGWHLSPGPIWGAGGDCPVMFYNGATQDVHWRIGWIAFDAGYTRIVARSEDPLIVPPPGEPGDTDIAFAASCVEEQCSVHLYYSVADKDLFRAVLHLG